MIRESELKNFFSIAETKVKLAEDMINTYGKELAPNFNSIDFWTIDENKVSSIIAFFLDPSQKHQQGDIYLNHFLKKLDLSFFTFDNERDIKVKCELRIDNSRRIDIAIIKNNFEQVIAIENKIYSGTQDQNNQIKDYLEYLSKKTKGNYCLLYLSPQDKSIADYSISQTERENYIDKNQLKIITYEEHVIDCLTDFGNITENIRVKSFLKDFEKKLRKMYMGEKNLNSKQIAIDMILDNTKNLEISFLVSNSLNEVKKQLKEKFEKQLLDIGNELGLEVSGLNLKPKNWSKNKITFNYESGGLLYGITRNQPDDLKPRFPEIDDFLESEIEVNFNVSRWWPIWQFFYRDIDKNEEFWIEIQNGEAKNRARKFIQLINDNFNTDSY
jgi:hypothetical protein